MRVLHLPTSVGGNPVGLSKAEKSLGINSTVVVISQNYFGYDVDAVISDRKEGLIRREMRKWIFFFSVLQKYDVFHFNFGRTLLSDFFTRDELREKGLGTLGIILYKVYTAALGSFELMLLRLLRKRIFVTFQGCDCRQIQYCKEHFQINMYENSAYSLSDNLRDIYRAKKVRLFSRFADVIYYLNPDLSYFLPSQAVFIPYAHVNYRNWPLRKASVKREFIRIGHAPTNRDIKGTQRIEQALDNLKGEGYQFEYERIEGLRNSEALEKYRYFDLFIDQILAGWYGGVSVEIMAMSIPVVAYIRSEDLECLPKGMREDIPIFNANPGTIQSVIREILDGKHNLEERGRSSRDYVIKWHDPKKIAQCLISDYKTHMR